jgi:hypothetical protein
MAAEARRRFGKALAIYLVVTGVYFALSPRFRIVSHTAFNHFALLADAWLHGRLDLEQGPPAYAQNNDFAAFQGKWYVTFPPFPAVLLLPLAFVAKKPENVRDGQFFLWLAGIAPAVLFLALEKLRVTGRSPRSERQNALLAFLFAFGSVYFFTALQGTVWFAAHVVGAALAAAYLLFALDAERPVLAGSMIGFGFLTRTPLVFAVPLFLFEAGRAALAPAEPVAPGEGAPSRGLRDLVRRLDKWRFIRSSVAFGLPIAVCVGAALVHNRVRFGKFGDFGYEYLTVAWQARMKRWGLFDYHFLARNLGVVLTNLPWYEPGNHRAPIQINVHGLPLWFTTPLFLWLLWPKRKSPLVLALYVTVAAVAIPGLFYQNTGWMQFGYRFSNDYAVFLFTLLAVVENRFGKLFAAAAVWSVAVNAFGAVTFDRGEFSRFYYEDPSQKILYQPD